MKLQTTNGAVAEHAHDDAAARSLEHADLRRKTTRGALVSSVSQAATLFFRVGSMVVMARLLLPGDFGLVGMVTAFTGFLGLFRDAGLSMAMVQRESITEAQVSTLFWINLAVGGFLAILSILLAPILVRFYGEPRLFLITVALGTAFLFNGVAAQHRAMLQRSMRFATLAAVDIVSLLFCIAAAVTTALAGGGYWALVVMTVALPALSALGVWIAGSWIPGRPQRDSGVRSMLVYGGTLTLNSVIVYLAYNADKVLIGKFCGADALGIYGRAYQLINLPTENLNAAIGSVAFPALSRVQNDPVRLKSYFLKGYGLFLSLVMPITMVCALFADDIIRVFLGAKWHEAASIFRLMAPTIVVFALINPFAWLMLACGHSGRSLRIALMIAPVVILSYVIGLQQGLHGVAAGFSIAMVLLVVPVIVWAKQGTLITTRDVLNAVRMPLLSILIGATAAWPAARFLAQANPPVLRLIAESAVLFGIYLLVLLFVMGQKAVYISLLRDIGVWPFSNRRGSK